MDQQPGKRQYRKRVAVAVPVDAAQGEGKPSDDVGNGQAGAVGATAQAELDRARQSLDWLKSQAWLEFQGLILAVVDSKGNDYVAAATCPDPLFSKIIGAYVVPVTAGQRGYVTKHGERKEV